MRPSQAELAEHLYAVGSNTGRKWEQERYEVRLWYTTIAGAALAYFRESGVWVLEVGRDAA